MSCVFAPLLCGKQTCEVVGYLKSWWLGNAMPKGVAAPMRLSEVVANTTWESLQRAGADCCVAIDLLRTLMCSSS